jgi:hypothetical protein
VKDICVPSFKATEPEPGQADKKVGKGFVVQTKPTKIKSSFTIETVTEEEAQEPVLLGKRQKNQITLCESEDEDNEKVTGGKKRLSGTKKRRGSR